MDERIDVLTATGARSGVVKWKREVHRDGDWHAAAHLWIITPDGHILLQKRSRTKENYPGLWDVSVAGHVSAGEEPFNSAIRECEEEIGLRLTSTPRQIATLTWYQQLRDDYLEREFHYVYLVIESVEPASLRLQESEVDDAKLVAPDEFRQFVERRDPSLVPHWEEYALLLNFLA